MSNEIDFLTRKKHEYWNHWIEYVFVSNRKGKPNGVTGKRLEDIKDFVFNDIAFWDDILERHLGIRVTPEEMRSKHFATYEHMIGNFSGMISQIMRDFFTNR